MHLHMQHVLTAILHQRFFRTCMVPAERMGFYHFLIGCAKEAIKCPPIGRVLGRLDKTLAPALISDP